MIKEHIKKYGLWSDIIIDNGHAFEVTKEGEIVWEFYHFEIVNNRRRVFYRFMRYPVDFIENREKKCRDRIAGAK